MTHEELLAKIEENHWKLFNFYSEDQSDKAIDFRKLVLKNTDALRAVVELHKPIVKNEGYLEIGEEPILICECDSWDEYDNGYPCPTIKAIEKELS